MFPRERNLNFRSSVWRRDYSRMKRRTGHVGQDRSCYPLDAFSPQRLADTTLRSFPAGADRSHKGDKFARKQDLGPVVSSLKIRDGIERAQRQG